MDLEENLRQVQDRIATAAHRVGRNPADVQLVAVTKTVDIDSINRVLATGSRVLGENRVQELTAKYDQVDPGAEWHLIGHLQTKKVKAIIGKVKLIHSLDSLALAEELQRRAKDLGLVVKALVQVNVAAEATKYGVAMAEALTFISLLTAYPNLQICGLMTIAPLTGDPEEVRPFFRELRHLADRVIEQRLPGIEMLYLSMGMTNDFEVAVEEGANLVRIGSAIFGPRY